MSELPNVTQDFGQAAPAFRLGAGLVVLAGRVFATQDAIAKSLTANYSPFQVVWIRFALHAFFVAIWMHARGHHHYLQTRRLPLQTMRAVALVVVSASMYWSVSLIPLAQATVVQFFSPIVVTILSVIFLGEQIGWRRCCAIVAGFFGVIIVMAPNATNLNIAAFLPVVTACALAVFVLLTRRLSSPDEAQPAFGLMPLICALIVLPVMPFVWRSVNLADVPWIITLGLCGTIAHICLQQGLRVASAATMAPFLYAQVLCAAALSAVFFEDPLGPSFGIGAAFIIGSGVAIWWFEHHANRAEIHSIGEITS